jgi:hypothetical protein
VALLKDIASEDPEARNLNPQPNSLQPGLQKRTIDSAEEAMGNVKQLDGQRALLVYRAVLFGAFCSTAADISSVAGTELGRRIVRFL